MKKSTKTLLIISIIIVVLILILVALYFRQIPCGGMMEDGSSWDGTCRFGPIFIENLKNGHFVNPFLKY
jgi:hypothetical protein